MELLAVHTVSEARAKLLEFVQPLFTRRELLSAPLALGRILAADIKATENVPAFARSTVDGYAVRSVDTFGASESIPAVLEHLGSVEMGKAADASPELAAGLIPGSCATVPTGGMLPQGADAMVMIEHTERFGANHVAVYSPTAKGLNVVQAGDDLAAGQIACSVGTLLGAAEVGIAASLGLAHLEVFTAPRISIISTGDELVAPHETPLPGQIRDINSWALAAQAQHEGFFVVHAQVVVDDEAALTAAVQQSMQNSDVVVISGGSSQGEKDATARVIQRVSSTGVLTHGLALKPGKPTITGFDEPSETLLLGLPGHPLSALMVFEVMLGWLKHTVQGTPHPLPVPALLAHNLPGSAGKDTLHLVHLAPLEQAFAESSAEACSAEHAFAEHASLGNASAEHPSPQLVATPLYTKSGLISALSKADGYVWIDRNTEGLVANTAVAVHPLRMF